MVDSSLATVVMAIVMVVTGVLMLAHVVRGVPKSPTAGLAQGDVVLVATKSDKKSKGKS